MILLDTHVVLWLTTDKAQLSAAAAVAIRGASEAGEGLAISGATLRELAMMDSKGRIHLPSTLAEYLRYVETMFVVLPITGAVAERSVRFTQAYPRDPSDQLIGATALAHRLSLVTKDLRIRESGEVNCIW